MGKVSGAAKILSAIAIVASTIIAGNKNKNKGKK